MFEEIEEAFFHCGEEVQRFIPLSDTKLVVEFYDEEDLLIIESDDQWTTLRHSREPWEMMDEYLSLGNSTDPSFSPDLRSVEGKDHTIEAEDGTIIPIHSSIIAPQWPRFKQALTQTKATNMKLNHPASWVEATVSFFYDERKPMDVDTASGVLVIAKGYHIPKLAEHCIKIIFASEMTKVQALMIWRRVRTFSETVAVYCMGQMKGPDCALYQREFMKFTMTATFDEKNHFAHHLCPSIHAGIKT